MAGERALPGLGLFAFWTPGSNGWELQNDQNMRKLSALVQTSVISSTTALPAAPVNGDMYLVPSGAAANANQLAVRDNGAWVYFVPTEGMRAYIRDTDKAVTFNGVAWAVTGGVEDAPSDGTGYVRKNAAWAAESGNVEAAVVVKTAAHTLVLADARTYIRMNVATAHVVTVPLNATVAFPIGTSLTIRQIGAGKTTLAGAAGVTINTAETLGLRKQHSTVALKKVAADEWDLTGDLGLVP